MTRPTRLITGTDFITVGTKDFDTAAEFYGSVLDLPLSKRWGQMPAAEFETGNLTIAVMQSDAFGLEVPAQQPPDRAARRRRRRGSHRARVTRRHVQGDTIDSGVCHQTFFEDPDGNALALHHRYAPPAPTG